MVFDLNNVNFRVRLNYLVLVIIIIINSFILISILNFLEFLHFLMKKIFLNNFE